MNSGAPMFYLNFLMHASTPIYSMFYLATDSLVYIRPHHQANHYLPSRVEQITPTPHTMPGNRAHIYSLTWQIV